MSRTSVTRDAWHPQTKEDRDTILLELQEVLTSPHFCNSKRYPALLKYVVENTLAGNAELLKERTLGVEVFDRAPSYDTNTDTVVRYTAGEVRKRLSLYYHELDRKPAIRISLPPGSYIPEFLPAHEENQAVGTTNSAFGSASRPEDESAGTTDPHSHWAATESGRPTIDTLQASQVAAPPGGMAVRQRRWRVAIALTVALLIFALAGWRYRAAHPGTPLDSFWAPVLHGQSSVLVCIGGSVFSQSHLSGVDTAGKDIQYPFVSMQSASAIADITSIADRSGATTQLQAAATTPLTELRDRPVILLGGYNNQWSMRLLDPLPFHFDQASVESIVDTAPPHARWERDPSLPYSSADDYALVARFRNTTTGNWVIVLAGIGRNGTEAAAQFATSPRYMQLLRDRIGSDLTNRNVEVVLKVNVVDGKTGAPSILAVRAW
jgi:hypothetical protein